MFASVLSGYSTASSQVQRHAIIEVRFIGPGPVQGIPCLLPVVAGIDSRIPPPPHPVWWECITTSQMFLHTHPFTVVFSVSPKRVLCPFWHFNSLFWASSHTATLFQYIFLPWNYLIWLSPWAPTNSFLLSITNSSAFCFLWENLTLICYLSCQWCFFKCFIYVKTENEEKYYLLWK